MEFGCIWINCSSEKVKPAHSGAIQLQRHRRNKWSGDKWTENFRKVVNGLQLLELPCQIQLRKNIATIAVKKSAL